MTENEQNRRDLEAHLADLREKRREVIAGPASHTITRLQLAELLDVIIEMSEKGLKMMEQLDKRDKVEAERPHT